MKTPTLSKLQKGEALRKKVIDHCRVDAGEKFHLHAHDPKWVTKELEALGADSLKKRAKKLLKKNLEALAEAQELLYASDTYSLLLIFQAMDAAGKDGTIKHVMSGINPQGCQVYSFKQPSAEELDHNYLWRYLLRMPERGRIGIFNRSYYEEVLVVKVHPEILATQKIPGEKGTKDFWKARYEDINNLERYLTRNGTIVLKFFLNVSKEEQRRRFLERLENPEKHWKFSEADLESRAYWDDFMEAYQSAINATATEWAPWHVIPADHKWIMRAIVSQIVTQAILALDLKYPEVSPDKLKRMKAVKEQLKKEEKEQSNS